MRPHLTLFLGIFSVMALSNAIVPVLPAYGADASVQGIIYSAYFLGAFLLTLPAGILSDRFGRIPLIRLGLAVTVTSGIFLTMINSPVAVTALRFMEGLGAGLFVASSMSAVNADPDHIRMSGWLMAFLNAGLVSGLLVSGWLASLLGTAPAGILLFALVASLPALCGFFVSEPESLPVHLPPGIVTTSIIRHRWLWYSSVVLIGITGVVTSLYPELSGAASDRLALWVAGMSIATIAAVLLFSRTTIDPVSSIKWAAVGIAGGVTLSYWSAAGFLFIGAFAGIVMIAQMAFLAEFRRHQGVFMGLFSTTSYLGMAIMPAAAGFIAVWYGFFAAFAVTVLAALSVAATIGWCTCAISEGDCVELKAF